MTSRQVDHDWELHAHARSPAHQALVWAARVLFYHDAFMTAMPENLQAGALLAQVWIAYLSSTRERGPFSHCDGLRFGHLPAKPLASQDGEAKHGHLLKACKGQPQSGT